MLQEYTLADNLVGSVGVFVAWHCESLIFSNILNLDHSTDCKCCATYYPIKVGKQDQNSYTVCVN